MIDVDPNETLREIREVLAQYGDMLDRPTAAEDPELRLPALVRGLDEWLTRGGFPPEAWREGPDAYGVGPAGAADSAADPGPDAAGEGYGVCLTCGAPCDANGCTGDRDHLAAVDIAPGRCPVWLGSAESEGGENRCALEPGHFGAHDARPSSAPAPAPCPECERTDDCECDPGINPRPAIDRTVVGEIPADWPARPLVDPVPNDPEVATCGHCGLSWDDGLVTSMTPAPSGRCPFEPFHVY